MSQLALAQLRGGTGAVWVSVPFQEQLGLTLSPWAMADRAASGTLYSCLASRRRLLRGAHSRGISSQRSLTGATLEAAKSDQQPVKLGLSSSGSWQAAALPGLRPREGFPITPPPVDLLNTYGLHHVAAPPAAACK